MQNTGISFLRLTCLNFNLVTIFIYLFVSMEDNYAITTLLGVTLWELFVEQELNVKKRNE